MSARAFNIAEVSFAGAAAATGCSVDLEVSFGGLPGGVVDAAATENSRVSEVVPTKFLVPDTELSARDILPTASRGVSFSLKAVIIVLGNVLPRSQMSTSFLILSYYAQRL